MIPGMVGMLLMLSPVDADRLLQQGKVEAALEIFRADTAVDQIRGRMYLQTFLAHRQYEAFFQVLQTLRDRFRCPSCYADLGWTAAVRARDPRRALEELLARAWGGRDPRLIQGLWKMYASLFQKPWGEVRVWAEAWAERHGPEGWRALFQMVRDVAPVDAVGYAFRGNDVRAARDLLKTLPPTPHLVARIPPGRWERTLVRVRLGEVPVEHLVEWHGSELDAGAWRFVLDYLPPGPPSPVLIRIADSLGLSALRHRVFTGEVALSQLEALCREDGPPEADLWEACGVGYLKTGNAERAFPFLRRVIMDRAGEEEALLLLWSLEWAIGRKDRVDRLVQAVRDRASSCPEDPLCSMVRASRMAAQDPEEARRLLESVVLQEEEPLRHLARAFLERGIPPVEVWDRVVGWLARFF